MKNNNNKLGYYDLGGNFVDMASQYTNEEPVSGYGNVDSYDRPKRPKKGSNSPHHTGPNATRKNIRQNRGGSNCFKNGKCK